MKIIADVLTGFVALFHVFVLILEMFLWQTPFGRRVFGMTKEAAATSAVLAKNQGLYNGFLAAGLIWSFFIPEFPFQTEVRIFFLTCVIVAGVFGAATAKPSILLTQGLPALLALIAVWLASTHG